jgi:hypothetical protein
MNYIIMELFRCFRFPFLMEGLDLLSGKGGEKLYEMAKYSFGSHELYIGSETMKPIFRLNFGLFFFARTHVRAFASWNAARHTRNS